MRIFKGLLALLMVPMLLPLSTGVASEKNDFYIIEDGNQRYLTEAELWDWQYEALGYIYNEFFARHGRAFRPGEKYDVFFRDQAWYAVNPKYHYGLLNPMEQANEKLVHQVLRDMRAQKTTNLTGKALPHSKEEAQSEDVMSFRSYHLAEGQKLEVYTGPGVNYVRSANGKASVSTNENVKIAGVENGWVVIEYEINNGSKRIGYVNRHGLKDKLDLDEMEFYYDPGKTAEDCILTDEPDGNETPLMQLKAETSVTLLGPYGEWCYVEVETEDGLARGFIPRSSASGWGQTDEEEQTDEAYGWEDETEYNG